MNGGAVVTTNRITCPVCSRPGRSVMYHLKLVVNSLKVHDGVQRVG
jgi:hypothetical protein